MHLKTIFLVLVIFWLVACDFAPPATIPPHSTPFVGIPTAAPEVTGAPTALPTRVPAVNPTAAPTSIARSTPTPVAPPPVVNPTRTGKGLDMRTLDWFKVVTTDPNLTYDPSIPPPPGVQVGPYVTLKKDANAAGHALVENDRILFMDMSGDGQEEAVISLFSGGTAGNLGLLVYTAVHNAPALADALPGYKALGWAD